MKVRLISSKKEGISNRFNESSLNEVIVNFYDDADSIFIKDLEVKLKNTWLPLGYAFKNHLLITDNYNTEFFEPINDEERKKGYRL